jgi:ribosomal protein S18 acetylase RimI-like enzyme
LLRPASSDDFPAQAQVQHAAWHEGFVPLLPADFRVPPVEELEAALGRADTQRVVAAEDKAVIGWVSFGASRDSDRDAWTGELRALYVHPDRWGRGAGRALVGHVIEALPEMGYREATLWSFAANERANRLYEGAGFERDGAERREPIFAGALELRYRRALQPPRV